MSMTFIKPYQWYPSCYQISGTVLAIDTLLSVGLQRTGPDDSCLMVDQSKKELTSGIPAGTRYLALF